MAPASASQHYCYAASFFATRERILATASGTASCFSSANHPRNSCGDSRAATSRASADSSAFRCTNLLPVVSWILEWSPHARLTAPPALIEHVIRELEAARAQY